MIDSILVIGPGSLVGSRFVEQLLENGVEVYGAGGKLDEEQKGIINFQPLDITDESQVQTVINSFSGQYVINFAGITVVDEIEKTRDEAESSPAYKVNVLGTRYLAKACKEANKLPIFISTESVFDGQNGPYSEDDEISSSPEGMSFYGWTKNLSEKEVINSGVPSLMVRISYPYRQDYAHKGDFARNLLKLYDEVKSGTKESFYPIFADQTLTPTFIDDLTPAVLTLIEKQEQGIFHITSPDITTPYDFCLELLRVARGVENPQELVPKGSIVEFQNTHSELAKRPIKGALNSDKIVKLGFTPTPWEKGILIYKE